MGSSPELGLLEMELGSNEVRLEQAEPRVRYNEGPDERTFAQRRAQRERDAQTPGEEGRALRKAETPAGGPHAQDGLGCRKLGEAGSEREHGPVTALISDPRSPALERRNLGCFKPLRLCSFVTTAQEVSTM